MKDAMHEYKTRLAQFVEPGNRDFMVTKGGLTYWGKAAGLSVDEIIADARAAGVTNRDGSIRTGWETARPRFVNGKPTEHYTPRAAKPKPPPTYPGHVRNLLARLDADNGTVDWVRETSPCLDWLGKPPTEQTALQLQTLFMPSDLVHVLNIAKPPSGRLGGNIRTAREWVRTAKRGEMLPGDGLLPNPITGEEGKTTTGKTSLIAQSCIARFRFALIEFDAMPLPWQFAFWRAFILTNKLAPHLASIVFSGGKSLHGLLHVGCRSREEWDAVAQRLVSLFSADSDERYRADPQSLRVRQATRIAGALRLDEKHNGALQELIYLNPAARTADT